MADSPDFGRCLGILEEGIALSTLFNPLAGPVGKLGFYGHYLGVNWIRLAGIIPVHMIYSVSLPILLLGFALPETRGKSLVVSRKWITSLLVMLGADVAALILFVLRGEHFWMVWPIFVGSFIAIALLILIARRAPPDMLRAMNETPTISPLKIGTVGHCFTLQSCSLNSLEWGLASPHSRTYSSFLHYNSSF